MAKTNKRVAVKDTQVYAACERELLLEEPVFTRGAGDLFQ